MAVARTTADHIKWVIPDNGIEFLFARFVVIHGERSAKLVPSHHLGTTRCHSDGVRRRSVR
jgi:hypothetical protein